jgi:cbb3-type cytochrome oxidase cytochrome c subunit
MRKLRADRRIGLMLGGVLLLTFAAIAVTIALPASDPSIATKARTLSAAEARGARIYRAEGCWFCAATTTKAKGQSQATISTSSYAGRSPSFLGIERTGPDLAKPTTMTEAALVKYLRKAHGKVPSFGYLSKKDLDALASFLLSLH